MQKSIMLALQFLLSFSSLFVLTRLYVWVLLGPPLGRVEYIQKKMLVNRALIVKRKKSYTKCASCQV